MRPEPGHVRTGEPHHTARLPGTRLAAGPHGCRCGTRAPLLLSCECCGLEFFQSDGNSSEAPGMTPQACVCVWRGRRF